MPGGLNEVVQQVGADASKYISEYRAALGVTKELQAANQDLMRTVAETQAAIRGSGGSGAIGNADDIARSNAAIRETLASLREYQSAVRDTAGVVNDAAAGYETMRASIAEVGDAVGAHTGKLQWFLQAQKAATDAVTDHVTVLGRAADASGGSSASVLSYVDSLGLLRDRARETTSALADTAAAVTAAANAGSGGGSATSSVLGDALAGRLAASYGGSSGGGGGGFLGGAAGGLLGGGGGSGGGGSFAGDFFGGLVQGSANDAAHQFATVAGFIGTWYPRIHYAMMAANEILATAGPAAVAAGAAIAVGAEGGQTAYGRLSAINTVGQSLGPALGQTPGSFLGLGQSLQKAQTAADPGVWELMGAAINSVKAATDTASGGLGNFWQMGTNTIDMLDRFGASVTMDFKNGVGTELSSVVQGGTQDLQQFGDVAGNIGKTFLNVAPALPGVGGDVLTTLDAATGGLAKGAGFLNQAQLLGPLLAMEAGSRYGPALVGGAASLIGKAGAGISGLGSGITGAALDAGLVSEEGEVSTRALAALRAGTAIGGVGAGVTSAGEALGALSPLTIGTAAGLTYMLAHAFTAKTPLQQQIAGMQSGVSQDNLSQALPGILANMGTLGGMLPGASSSIGSVSQQAGGGNWWNYKGFVSDIKSMVGLTSSPKSEESAALQQSAAQFNQLLAAGPALQQMLGGGSLQNAYSLADMAGIQASQLGQIVSGTPAQKAAIQQQLLNEQAGYKVMASSPGVYGANVNAVQAMQGLSGSHLGTVNSAWDQVLQNATEGTASATGFAGSLQNFQSLAGSAQIAKALTGFTSPASQAAWSAYSSPSTTSPGLIQQIGSQADWLRTAMTVSGGVIGQGQFNQATGYEAKQALPYAKDSPAALAQLGVITQQMGGPAYNASESQAKNYAAIAGYIDKAAGSAKQYTDIQNKATIATAGVSQQALNFGATMKTNVYSALAGGSTGLPQVSADMEKFKAALSGGGTVSTSGFKSAAQGIAADLAGVKASAGDVSAIIGNALQGKGLNTGQITSAISTVQKDMNALQPKSVKVTATADSAEVNQLKAAIAGVHGKSVNLTAVAPLGAVSALNSAIASVHSKTVTINVDEVYSVTGGAVSVGGKASPYTPSGAAANLLPSAYTNLHGQAGMRIPGYGGGDIFPALLEPGEAVVPKHLVGAVAPFLGAHGVPGFAGGMIPSALAGQSAHLPLPASASAVLDQLLAELSKSGGWKQAGVNIINGITYSLNDPATAAKAGAALVKQSSAAATALTGQFQTSMNYARSTAASSVSGLNLGGMNTDPATGNGTIQEQMQSYLGSVQHFTGDLKSLSGQGLSKAVIQQLVAAGPVQGDALSQSIMNDYGGVGMVNSLYKQIGKASNALGAQAGMSVYGGSLSPGLTGGGVTNNNVSISISAPGGASSDAGLTTAQIKTITEMVQAKLLQQAKRNPQTGVKLPGKGS